MFILILFLIIFYETLNGKIKMVNSYTGSIAYYKDGMPFTADGQVVIVITMKDLQEGKSLGGDDSTVIGGDIAGGIAGGIAGVVVGGARLDLRYAEYRAVMDNSIKLIQKLSAEQKARTEEFLLSMNREREKNNVLTQQNKNRVQINNINITQLAHDNNRRMEEEAHRIVQMRGVQIAQEKAVAAKKAREEAECKLKENERQLKLKKEEQEKYLASLSPEVRTVEIARKNIELANSELARVDADIQSKRAVVARLSGELLEFPKIADHMKRHSPKFFNTQGKLDRMLKRIKDEYTAAEESLNVATNCRTDKVKKVTGAVRNLKLAEDNLANSQIKNAVDSTIRFYEALTKEYGEKYSLLAQELANKTKGKKIGNVNEALEAFEKYKDILNKKFNKTDRYTISKALESIKYDEWAKHLDQFSKYLKITGHVSFLYNIVFDLLTAIRTDNWKPLFLTLEKQAVDVGIGFVVVFTFSIIAGTTLGIFGVAIMTGILCSLVDKNDLQQLNEFLGI